MCTLRAGGRDFGSFAGRVCLQLRNVVQNSALLRPTRSDTTSGVAFLQGVIRDQEAGTQASAQKGLTLWPLR
jgi:hypothetical protein